MDQGNGDKSLSCHWFHSRIVLAFCISFFALVGVFVIKETTRFGAGLRPDSFSYLSAAENLKNGGGYGRVTWDGGFKPVTGFPPMFSITVAAIHKIGLPAYASARVLNGLLFGMFLFLAGIATYLASRSIFFSMLSALVFFCSSVLVDIFSWAHSEPLYLFLSLLGIVLISLYLSNPHRRVYFWTAAAVMSSAFLTRYAGSALVAAGFFAILLAKSLDLRKRIRDLALYLLVTFIPMGLFLARNQILTGNLTNRPAPFWHPPVAERWYEAAETFLNWLLPPAITSSLSHSRTFVILAMITVGIVLVYFFSKAQRNQQTEHQEFRNQLITSLFLYLLFNIFLILATVYFLDVLTPLDDRILVPIHFVVLFLAVLVLSQWWEVVSRQVRVFIVLISAAILIAQAHQAYQTYERLRAEPQGYAGSFYRNSETLDYVRRLPGVPIFTNDLPAVYFWAQRIGVFIPNTFNPSSKETVDPADFQEQLDSMREILRDNHGYLIIFGPNPRQRLPASQFKELTDGLTLIEEFNDGLIYRFW
jgi:hypothetical protein